jgi:hypothetical protein
MGRVRVERADRAKLEHYEASLELSELLPDHRLVELLREQVDAVLAGSK